ncbi:hypothetical protein [Arthrobacter sp. CG_A4]|uniref:hypothetical protein n=1 Tax=Arthrobacter sp. CG_A4 TaxID=3071706 RepID=UPI002DFCAD04|nr:pimeloyl-ACP methyl ester carboxylesterase [Arthrobacter sp. CG_A4]
MRSVITGVFLAVWRCRAYTLSEKINIGRGMSYSRRLYWDDFIKTDLTIQIDELDLPLYFFTGLHDYTANHEHARDFFELIKAPVKGFYTFRESAHSPLFEEPQRARLILKQDVLTGRNSLGD